MSWKWDTKLRLKKDRVYPGYFNLAIWKLSTAIWDSLCVIFPVRTSQSAGEMRQVRGRLWRSNFLADIYSWPDVRMGERTKECAWNGRLNLGASWTEALNIRLEPALLHGTILTIYFFPPHIAWPPNLGMCVSWFFRSVMLTAVRIAGIESPWILILWGGWIKRLFGTVNRSKQKHN